MSALRRHSFPFSCSGCSCSTLKAMMEAPSSALVTAFPWPVPRSAKQ